MVRTSYRIECGEAATKRLLSALDTMSGEKDVIRSLGGRADGRRLCGRIDGFRVLPGMAKEHPFRTVDVMRVDATEGLEISDFRIALREAFPGDDDFRVYFMSEDAANRRYRTNDVEGIYFGDLFRLRYKVAGIAGEETFSGELDLKDRLNALMQLPPDTDVSRETVSRWNKAHEAGGEYIRVYEYEVIDEGQ